MAAGSHPREGGDPEARRKAGLLFDRSCAKRMAAGSHPRGFQQTHVWSSGKRLSTDACPVIQRPAARRAFCLIAHARSAWLPEVIPAAFNRRMSGQAGDAFQQTPAQSSRRNPPFGGFRAFRRCTSSCHRDTTRMESRHPGERRDPSSPEPRRRSPSGFQGRIQVDPGVRRDDVFGDSSAQRLRRAFARRQPSSPAPLTTPASRGTIAPCPFPTSITACGC